MGLAIELTERGWVPDALVAQGIRARLRAKAFDLAAHGAEDERAFLAAAEAGPLAIATDAANAQHYEVPPAFFERVLGPRLKYSCCLYPQGDESLGEAEEAMLRLTCARAEIADGQRVLDLGCGWGSLSLWIAEHYPKCHVTGVSNSRDQRTFILARAAERGLSNLEIITADMNEFAAHGHYDRITSVEMFEHMRNYPELLRRVRGWLAPGGRVFVHIFVHRQYAYPYSTEGDENWMGKYFFTGGTMPSYDLLTRYDRDLVCEERWAVNGTHYAKTSRDWLRRQDAQREEILAIFRETYGPAEAARWFQRWRMFFLACAEFFAWHGGEEWFVAHYRFRAEE